MTNLLYIETITSMEECSKYIHGIIGDCKRLLSNYKLHHNFLIHLRDTNDVGLLNKI